MEEPRDLVLEIGLSISNVPVVGDGSGVMSTIAAICGEDIVVPGETEPAEECKCARILGTRKGRLEAEVLDRIRDSDSID